MAERRPAAPGRMQGTEHHPITSSRIGPRRTLKWPPIQGRVGLLQTINRYVSAVDPMRARRRQKSDDIGYLLTGPQTAHRKTVANIVIKIFLVGEAVAIPAIARDKN